MRKIVRELDTQCCIAGGGPAGIMLGYLLARAGVEVTVLEKYPDFFRDFRGDTIHPSTMQVLDELGLLDKFLKLPHDKTKRVSITIGGKKVTLADFTHLRNVPAFVGFVPQWDFLTFLAKEGKRFPNFHLLMETKAIDLVKKNGEVVGVVAQDKKGKLTIRASVVVGADGRSSTIRKKAQLRVINLGAPIDVLWFRLPRKHGEKHTTLGSVNKGKMLVLLNRGSYWQCGYIIKKNEFTHIQKEGLATFRAGLVELAPQLKDAVKEITHFDDVKLLSVVVDYLPRWYLPNLVCIGDAAHAMSPVGGVGVNLAIQDAVAAANILAPAFQRQTGVQQHDLRAIQKRRAWPARIIQTAQVLIHKRIIIPTLSSKKQIRLPLPIKLFVWMPLLRRLPAWIIGKGIRPEHVAADTFAQ